MSKLNRLANSAGKKYLREMTNDGDMNFDDHEIVLGFEKGFKAAFSIINETLEKETKKLEIFPYNGERVQTLRLYNNMVNDILTEMENE